MKVRNKKWWLGAGLLAVAACGKPQKELREWTPADHQPPPAVAPEGQGEGNPADETARAVAALWSIRCASCHGEAGRGDGRGRPPGATLPDMTQPGWQAQRTDGQLAEAITKGRGLMPAFGDEVTEEGVRVLIGHVRSFAAGR